MHERLLQKILGIDETTQAVRQPDAQEREQSRAMGRHQRGERGGRAGAGALEEAREVALSSQGQRVELFGDDAIITGTAVRRGAGSIKRGGRQPKPVAPESQTRTGADRGPTQRGGSLTRRGWRLRRRECGRVQREVGVPSQYPSARSCGAPRVPMVQPADLRDRADRTEIRRCRRPPSLGGA